MHDCCNFNIMQRFFLYHMLVALVIASTPGEESDRLALLDLKSRVFNDPFGIMNSWNDSTHFCDWVGVTCSNSTHKRRVEVLDLNAQNLIASIPPSIGNMTSLIEIQLSNNKFLDNIPQEFGRLQQLRSLRLSNNSFSGEIPTNISHCTQLVILRIDGNSLSGQIPHQFFSLTKLKGIDLSNNNLFGTIPAWIGNFSSLFRLEFGFNNFHGNIPSELGGLPILKFFAVSKNYLTGRVPLSIYNITSLTQLSLVENYFHGTIPDNVGFTLPNIKAFFGGVNYFTGPIPTSFVNASNLQLLDFSRNNLTGMIPHDFGKLRDFEELNVGDNKLGSGKVGDLNFINSLANSTSLNSLGLALNRFGGVLPSSIANLSIQLRILSLAGNMLSGSIPYGIGNLINLQFIALNLNYLTGSIPSSIGNLHNLRVLLLEGNNLTGSIPSIIGNLSLLTNLYLGENKLEGSIPSSLGQCKSLLSLYLSHNNLNGTIPKEVLGLSSLSILLHLDHNSFTGPLPNEVGKLISLSELDVSNNKLSGHIPTDLDQCISMERLYLQGNQLEGPIPQSLKALKGLEQLDLSRNNLCGPIPQFFDSLRSLLFLNLSYNNFEGQVPKEGVFSNTTMISIIGNNNLCGGLQVLHLPPCSPNRTHSLNKKFLASKVLITVLSTITFTIILVGIFFVGIMLKKKSKKDTSTPSSTKVSLPQISYLELRRSTDEFSMDNLIGSGSFGSVYKGVLSNDGSIVAIKVLNLQQQGASKSFVDECNTLSSIRHRNLLKIITSCSSIDFQGNEFKAIVYNFMSNGNLDYWLHPTDSGHNQRRLSLLQRLNIAIDIASGLDYLHNHCETSVVHCDLKPSNILLDDDMVAHVGDFGLARFMLEEPNDQLAFSQTMSLTLKGSIGYIPPEYGSSGRISREGDIFSFGIVLLEMIIGKRPTDNTFGEGVDIHSFANIALPHSAMSIVDPTIPFKEMHHGEENENGRKEMTIMIRGEDDREIKPKWVEECVVSIIRIGLSCSLRTPRERTPMSIVVVELQEIKKSYLKHKKPRQRYHRYLFPRT